MDQPITEPQPEKEPKIVTNRGYIVDLVFNFPQGVSVDKQSYVNGLIQHVRSAFESTETDFEKWLKKEKCQ